MPLPAPGVHRAVCLLLFVLPALVGCDAGAPGRVDVPVDSAAGEVAFELAGRGGAALLVPVMINGEGPFQFVLDTGATLVCLDQELSERLALPQRRGALGMGAGVGGSGSFQLVTIDTLEVGAAKAFDVPACVLDLQHIQGIGVELEGLLGLNFLKSFRMTLDFDRNVLLLQD